MAPIAPRGNERMKPTRDARSSDGTSPAGSSPTGNAPASQRIPPRRTWLSFFFILLVNVMLARMLFPRGPTTVKVPYTLFREQVTVHNVQAIYSRGASITG